MTERARLAWTVGACAILAISVLVGELRVPLNADASWFLYSAMRLLRGQRMYTDILEVNPPLIVWLNLPVAALSHWLGWAPSLVFRSAVLLVAGASIVECTRILRRDLAVSPLSAGLTAVALTFAFLPLVGGMFGQREHLVLMLCLPLAALAAVRCHSTRIPTTSAAMIGIVGALGLAIKPHFAAVWLLLLVARSFFSRGRVRFGVPEDVAVLAVAIAYAVALTVLTPDYFGFVLANARNYYSFGRHSLAEILFVDSPAIGWYVSVAAWLLLHPAPRRDAVGGMLVAVGTGFLVAVAAQHKGWSYHFYPVIACAFLLAAHVGAVAVGNGALTEARSWSRRVAVGVFGSFVLLFAGIILWLTGERALGPLSDKQLQQISIRDVVRRQVGVRSMMILSSQQKDGAPLALETRLEWSTGYPALWVPLVYYESYAGESHQVRYRPPAEMSEPESAAFHRVVRDVVGRPPDLLLVEGRALNERRTRFPGGFDYLAYFGQDAAFARVASEYVQIANVGGLLVLRRRPVTPGAS